MAEKCQRSYINAFAFSSKRANYSCFTVRFKHCLEPQIAHIENFSGASPRTPLGGLTAPPRPPGCILLGRLATFWPERERQVACLWT